MKGIIFGVFLEDARQRQGESFSRRQINIFCKKVLAKGKPKLEVVEGFLRDECLRLFDLSQ